jgi:hypothetical protein
MGKPYSEDLRERVAGAAKDGATLARTNPIFDCL